MVRIDSLLMNALLLELKTFAVRQTPSTNVYFCANNIPEIQLGTARWTKYSLLDHEGLYKAYYLLNSSTEKW